MPEPTKRAIFRQASLERLTSPERIDQLMIVVPLRDWIPLGLLVACAAGVFAWGVGGRVPVTVEGRGAFIAGRGGLAVVAYFANGDGKRVRPGMRVHVTPDTVEREEYGGVLGDVVGVADFPVTAAGALNVVGNEALAQELTAGGRGMEVSIALLPGPRWSGARVPSTPITAGTTGTVRVTLERRAPITYVLPFLREASGLD